MQRYRKRNETNPRGDCIMNMKEITQLQIQYMYFKDMLERIEKIKKKTPGNGFAKMKCKEKMAELEAIFDEIDFAAQITYD